MKNSAEPSVRRKRGEGEFKINDLFGDLPEPVIKAFEPIGITMNYPKGTAIFFEGDPATGVYMLCRGRTKMSTHSVDGRALILRICGPGEWLGLSSAIADQPHEVTAEVVEKSHFSCVAAECLPASLMAREQVIVWGMETHVCVLQTVIELLDAGFDVHIVKDAVMSRDKRNWLTAIDAMTQAGALTPHQVLVSLVVITLFVPCIATVLMIVKEQGARRAAGIVAFVFPFAFLMGGLVHRLLGG